MSMDAEWTCITKINEPECRAWLLCHADTLDLTLFDNSVPSTCLFGLLSIARQQKGDIVNPDTLETFKRLEPWFLRRETNNLMYGGAPQGKRAQIDHYYFEMSEEIKAMLNQQTLLWEGYDFESLFKGFEDPVFYKDEVMVGYVISHEHEGIINR